MLSCKILMTFMVRPPVRMQIVKGTWLYSFLTNLLFMMLYLTMKTAIPIPSTDSLHRSINKCDASYSLFPKSRRRRRQHHECSKETYESTYNLIRTNLYRSCHVYWIAMVINSCNSIDVKSETQKYRGSPSTQITGQYSKITRKTAKLKCGVNHLSIRGGTSVSSVFDEKDDVDDDDDSEQACNDSNILLSFKGQSNNDQTTLDDDVESSTLSWNDNDGDDSAVTTTRASNDDRVKTNHVALNDSNTNIINKESSEESEKLRNRKGEAQLQQNMISPPNTIYRFLLRQGYYGHVVVMALALVTEWFSLYVPPLASFLAWIIIKIIPQSTTFDEYGNYNNKPKRKMSRKERRLQAKYDDEMALQQLRRLDKKVAKYRYVSDEFLRRHEIGIYSKTKVTNLKDVNKIVQKQRKKSPTDAKNQKTLKEKDNNAEDDDDWVVEALTVKKPNKKGFVIQPSISIGLGSKSKPSIGIDFAVDFGTKNNNSDRRDAIAHAITTDSKRRIKNRTINTKRQQPSNTDSILDKFRSVTGTDSVILSRTLLGAYPGDAVPITEAANPNGVVELARRYGYGEWYDDDDGDGDEMEDRNQLEETYPMRRMKKKIKQGSTESNASKFKKDLLSKISQRKKPTDTDRFSFQSSTRDGGTEKRLHSSAFKQNIAHHAPTKHSKEVTKAPYPSTKIIKKSIILQRHLGNNSKKTEETVTNRFGSFRDDNHQKMYTATELLSEKRNKLLSKLHKNSERDET